ncbi:MAG: MATE family efflux transporter [Candidatus Thermoplasmatota archaeon]|nr:MATE family efflux transporter [Candidatus Thermoplasmatota archaeon]
MSPEQIENESENASATENQPPQDGTLPPLPGSMTRGVEILMGDPKKALIKLSLPMIVALSVNTIYNLVDAIWVAGLGPDALSAVGFFFPFFFMATAIAVGIGTGGGAAISRRIGSKDKKGADSVASHTMVLMFLSSILFSVPFFVLAEPIFAALGAGRTLGDAVSYSQILFGGAFFIFFAQISFAILRAEGDANRAMFAMVLGAVLNIILDPIFIYTLGMGVSGAAWATLISIMVTSVLVAYWLFIKKDTYISLRFRGFRFRRSILKDIFVVGIPATVMQTAMSLMMLMINLIIVQIGGTDGVAIFTTGWRVVMVAILPLLGIASAIVSISGAAYGSKEYGKLRMMYVYALRIGMFAGILTALATFIFAPGIVGVFTTGQGGERIAGPMVDFLRIITFFYPAAAFGMFSSSMFQGVGRGSSALGVTLLRTILLAPPLAYFMGVELGMGLQGIWWGVVIANILGALVAFTWAMFFLKCLEKTGQTENWAMPG